MCALLVLLNLQQVEAHDKADARFWYSEQVSGWKLAHVLAVLVTMTVLLCVAVRRRCGLRAAVAGEETQYLTPRQRFQHGERWCSISDP